MLFLVTLVLMESLVPVVLVIASKRSSPTNPNNSHVDGALAMARSQDPNSAGSQFYFCLGPQHGLDSGYTVFGTTIEEWTSFPS